MTDLAVAHDELRPLMFSIAYRMLGSVTEAEDVVQEAFLRMHKATAAGEAIETLDAYATTVTTRVAIDTLRSARVRRETYVGPWLPEPILDTDEDPAHRIEADETLSLAFLVVLERLAPVERAVFLLREVFGYEYERIASVVEKSEANCRQLLARAKQHLDTGRPEPVTPQREHETVQAFFAAVENGDLEQLERVLADDITLYGDGGGKAPALGHPLEGSLTVARFLLGLARRGAKFDVQLRPATVNGQPGMLQMTPDGEMLGILVMDIADSGISTLRNQINPDKLQHIGPVGDLNALLFRAR